MRKFSTTIALFFLLMNCQMPTENHPKVQFQAADHIEKATDSDITLDYIMGKFEPSTQPNFTPIDRRFADRERLFLRTETYESFKKMFIAAEKVGVRLTIISATRNFDYQKKIWETKWQNLAATVADPTQRARKILEFSAMPSSSRHHWGTDVDFTSVSNDFFDKPEGKRIYSWLQKNAAEFGFCQPYSAGRKAGYNEEKWHWTYLPLSRKMTDFARENLKNNQITGFKGAETATTIDVVKNYVLGINPDCD